jgi:6-pyruvoyltetrahydropterin/6-carboxytetrahydropterin synthase
MNVTITQHLSFEAAHFLPYIPGTQGLGRMHGHSFAVELHLEGEVDAATGVLVNLDTGIKRLRDLVESLDHRILNEIDGLNVPTLENIGAWLLTRGKQIDPRLSAVSVGRPSVGQKCTVRLAA